jgi:hypothetical protein
LPPYYYLNFNDLEEPLEFNPIKFSSGSAMGRG